MCMLSRLFLLVLLSGPNAAESFRSIAPIITVPLTQTVTRPPLLLALQSKQEGEDSEEAVVIEPGSEGDVFSKEQWTDIQEAQPSEVDVMKKLLGVNVFTYVLAALIIFFGGLNLILGPGWLGGTLGIQGTGSIEEVSPSLPDTLDLNREEYML